MGLDYPHDYLGARLKWARLKKGLSRRVVAERLGVCVRTVGNHENNLGDMAARKVARYALMYGRTLDWLILGGKP